MAKKLSPFNFTKAVMRSFMAESGLEPRYEQAQAKAPPLSRWKGNC